MVIEINHQNQGPGISLEKNLIFQGIIPHRKGLTALAQETVYLRLYVAGCMMNSKEAIANISSICEEHLAGHYSLEIIDALEEPLFALRDDVMVAPTLVKLYPAPMSRVTGNLSQKDKVLGVLGLKGQIDGAALAEIEQI